MAAFRNAVTNVAMFLDMLSSVKIDAESMQQNIEKWLGELGLGRYIDVFIKNDVDFRAISELTEDDLKELGVSLGHRRNE
jgi:hypothetical protein